MILLQKLAEKIEARRKKTMLGLDDLFQHGQHDALTWVLSEIRKMSLFTEKGSRKNCEGHHWWPLDALGIEVCRKCDAMRKIEVKK